MHRNIIQVLGLYSTKDVKAILLEYMPNGTLHESLHGNAPLSSLSKDSGLSWVQRFRILLGVTHGMVYLHHEIPNPIIHRDLKPSNILLDADLDPKLCDFGINFQVCGIQHWREMEVSASNICGTFGYMPPEYGTGARVGIEGDVYSFGVVLLELLTARAVANTGSMIPSGQDECLVGMVRRSFQDSTNAPREAPLEVLDSTLKTEAARDPTVRRQMMLTVQLGLFCTRAPLESRPSMYVVLEFLVEIQKTLRNNIR